MTFDLKARILINFMCGLFVGLALVYTALWPFVFILIIPLLFFAVEDVYTGREVFVFGLVWGFGLMSVSLSFIFAMLPLTWLGVTSAFAGAVAATCLWVLLSCSMAVSVGLFALSVRCIRKVHSLVFLYAAPLFWVALELVRATSVSILAAGPGTTVGPHFTFGFLGYVLSGAHGLLFLAQLGGPFFLSWLVILINVIAFLVLRILHEQKKAVSVALAAAFLAVPFAANSMLPAYVHISIGPSVAEIESTRVALVHSEERAYFKTTPGVEQQIRTRLGETILDSLHAAPDASVVVLPEDSRFERIISNPRTDTDRKVLETLTQQRALLIDSSRVDRGAGTRSVIYAYDFKENAPLQFSGKSYLVPFGEYIPYIVSFAGPIFGFRAQIQNLAESRASYVSAPWNPQERIIEWNGISYGILSCSELFSPYLVKGLTHAGADVVVAMSSQSWMQNDSPVLYNQMLGMAIVDSAWAGKPYMQATNKAPNIYITIGQ